MVRVTDALIGATRGIGSRVEAAHNWFPIADGVPVSKSAAVNSNPEEYQPTSAMQIAAINGAVSFLTRQVGASEVAPEEYKDGRWRSVVDLDTVPDWALGIGRPNIHQSAYEWKQQLAENLLVEGESFIIFEDTHKDSQGYPQFFTVWPSNLVHPEDTGYRVQPIEGGTFTQTRRFEPYNSLDRTGNLLHIKFSGRSNHRHGISPLRETAQALRGMLAADAHSELYFITGGMPQGYLVCKNGDMSDEKKKQMVAHYRTVRENPSMRHIPLVLDGDWEFVPASEGANDSQLLDVRKFSFNLAASIFGVLKSFLGAPDDRTTFDRSMQKFQYDTAIAPLFRMIQWPLSELLPRKQRVKLVLDYFGDSEPLEKARYYERAIGAGWLLPSEVRDREGLDPVEGIDDMVRDSSTGMNPLRDRTDDSDSSKDVGQTDFPENRT